MKIKISDNASTYYKRLHMQEHRPPINWEWYENLKKIDGKFLEVETDHLFKDQFNTVPIEGISELGLRIMDNLVDEVINDVRIGKKKCNWCGTVTENENTTCPKCNKTEYFEEWDLRTTEEVFRDRGYDMYGNKYPKEDS